METPKVTSRGAELMLKGTSRKTIPVPFSIKVLILCCGLGLLLSLYGALVYVLYISAAWETLLSDLSALTSAFLILTLILTLLLCIVIMRSPPIRQLWGEFKNEDGLWVFDGIRTNSQKIIPIALTVFCWTLAATTFKLQIDNFPLPSRLKKETKVIAAPVDTEKLVPVFFWDYATWFNPAWLQEFELVIPYEKGPPQKLLSKILLRDTHTQKVVLELNGKRPRNYANEEVIRLFDTLSGINPVYLPSTWPLLYRMTKESGLLHLTGSDHDSLQLQRLSHGNSNVTQTIGHTSDQNRQNGFFLSQDGAVFQFRCAEGCPFTRMLELTEFPEDARGSLAARKTWTAERLKVLLSSTSENKENAPLLMLYITSMLTLDPRDPEAFFHLGKLSRNIDTIRAAIRYGKDTGMEPAKLAELQTLLSAISP